MDSFTFMPTAPITQSVELYTARYFVTGAISGPFKRTSDHLNHKDQHFVRVEQATLTSLSGQPAPQSLNTPLLMSKDRLHIVANTPEESSPQQKAAPESPPSKNREFHIQKTSFPCVVLTDIFHLQGFCYLRRDTDLLTLLEIGDTFLPVTNCAIHLVANAKASWHRDFVLVNKGHIEVIYALET